MHKNDSYILLVSASGLSCVKNRNYPKRTNLRDKKYAMSKFKDLILCTTKFIKIGVVVVNPLQKKTDTVTFPFTTFVGIDCVSRVFVAVVVRTNVNRYVH